jgi:hypothetical protein
MVACAIAGLLLLLPAVAPAERDFTVSFTANAQGDITGTGNTLLTCRDSDSLCAAARRPSSAAEIPPGTSPHRVGPPVMAGRGDVDALAAPVVPAS